jgi:hypothetical protein
LPAVVLAAFLARFACRCMGANSCRGLHQGAQQYSCKAMRLRCSGAICHCLQVHGCRQLLGPQSRCPAGM